MAKRQKKDTPSVFDYRDVKTLPRYTNVYGQIESAKLGSCYQARSPLGIVAIRDAWLIWNIFRRTKVCGAPANSSKDEIKEQGCTSQQI